MPTPLDYRTPRDDRGRPSRFRLLLRAFAWVVAATALGFLGTFGVWCVVAGWAPPDGFILTGIGFVVGLIRANVILGEAWA